MDRLNIIDPRKIKITKIKNWAIYFDYDGEKYLLHESVDGYEKNNTLYKKSYDGNRYELEFITSNPYMDIHHLIPVMKKGKTYKSIDKIKFANMLTYYEFANGCLDSTIQNLKFNISKYKEQRQKLQEEIRKIDNTIIKLTRY